MPFPTPVITSLWLITKASLKYIILSVVFIKGEKSVLVCHSVPLADMLKLSVFSSKLSESLLFVIFIGKHVLCYILDINKFY